MGGPIKCKAAAREPPSPGGRFLAQDLLHGSEEAGWSCGRRRAREDHQGGCVREEAAPGWFKTKKSPSHGARSRSAPGAKRETRKRMRYDRFEEISGSAENEDEGNGAAVELDELRVREQKAPPS